MQPTTLPLQLTQTGLALALLLLASAPASAQTESTTPLATTAVEPRIERIHIEDDNTVIDELRVGGETRSIDVKPKGGLPAYQVAPTSGERSWKVLGF